VALGAKLFQVVVALFWKSLVQAKRWSASPVSTFVERQVWEAASVDLAAFYLFEKTESECFDVGMMMSQWDE